jgi:hypothetical protein
VSAIRRWADDVRARRFPSEAESYAAGEDALEALRQLAPPAAS